MADTQEIRRQNLKRLVSEHEGMNKLAARLGLTKGAYISQLLSDPPVRGISEKTARKWEKTLGLQEGWLDGPPRTHVTTSVMNRTPTVDTALLERVLVVVLDELKVTGVTLTNARLASLVAMQYSDAFTAGRVDAARVQQIVQLLKR